MINKFLMKIFLLFYLLNLIEILYERFFQKKNYYARNIVNIWKKKFNNILTSEGRVLGGRGTAN